MDRMWLTRTDRIETLTRGVAAGSIAGALLGAVALVGAATSGHALLWPWRLAASVLIGRDAFTMNAGLAIAVGWCVHVAVSVAAGSLGAMLYEWSEWSRSYQPGVGLMCLAGAAFGAVVWMLNFAIIAAQFLPWMWRLDQPVLFVLHCGFGAAVGLVLNMAARHARNPPDSMRPARA